MPELPEVETVRRGLEDSLVGQRISRVIARRKDLRFPIPNDIGILTENKMVISVGRKAKFLMIKLIDDTVILSHLGMSGRWTIISEDFESTPGRFAHGGVIGTGDGPHDWVIIQLENGTEAVYSDPRRFGFIDVIESGGLTAHPMLKKLGPDPLPDSLTPDMLNESLIGRTAPLKTSLLNQEIVAGLGNIYVCEALSRSRLSPRRRSGSIASERGPTARLHRLVSAIHDVISEAIDAGGSTLSDYRGVQGDHALGYFPLSFQVYGREGEPCLNEACKGTVVRYVQSGRSTYSCPTCQR